MKSQSRPVRSARFPRLRRSRHVLVACLALSPTLAQHPVLDTLFLTTPRDPVEPQQSGRTHPVLTDPRTNYHDTRLASSGASCSMGEGEDKVGGDAYHASEASSAPISI